MQNIFSVKSIIYLILYYFRIFRYESQYYMLKNFRNTKQQEREKEGDSNLKKKKWIKRECHRYKSYNPECERGGM